MPKQLFKRSHRPRRVFAGTAHGNPVTDPAVLGSLMPQVFFKNLAQLLPSREPVKGELLIFMKLPYHVVVHDRVSYSEGLRWGVVISP